jgi:hypothetical protein
MVGSCEVANETSCSVEVAEFLDRGFAAAEGFCSNVLDTINKLILLSEIWSSYGSKDHYYIILGYDVMALTHTDFSEVAATGVFGFELWILSILRSGELVSIFQWRLPRQKIESKR